MANTIGTMLLLRKKLCNDATLLQLHTGAVVGLYLQMSCVLIRQLHMIWLKSNGPAVFIDFT